MTHETQQTHAPVGTRSRWVGDVRERPRRSSTVVCRAPLGAPWHWLRSPRPCLLQLPAAQAPASRVKLANHRGSDSFSSRRQQKSPLPYVPSQPSSLLSFLLSEQSPPHHPAPGPGNCLSLPVRDGKRGGAGGNDFYLALLRTMWPRGMLTCR